MNDLPPWDPPPVPHYPRWIPWLPMYGVGLVLLAILPAWWGLAAFVLCMAAGLGSSFAIVEYRSRRFNRDLDQYVADRATARLAAFDAHVASLSIFNGRNDA